MRCSIFVFVFICILMGGCIKDDVVDDTIKPTLKITTTPDSIAINNSFQFDFMYLNNIGVEQAVAATWSSSNPAVIGIDANGLASASMFGSSFISVNYDNGIDKLKDSLWVSVGNNTVVSSENKSGTIASTSSYKLTGDFEIRINGNDLILELADNYEASTALPGLYVYLTNNRSTSANALEIGAVQVYAGAHSYSIPNTGINDYQYVLYFCKPFNVKVGDGEIL